MLKATGIVVERAAKGDEALANTEDVNGEEAATLDMASINQRFLEAYANPPKEAEIDFTPSVRAALFLLNDDLVVSWTLPKNNNLASKLSELESNQIAQHLFLSVLSRKPTAEESTTVTDHLESESDRTVAISNLIWALLASTEFATNH